MIHPGLASRPGYRPTQLRLADGMELPMPTLTAAGREIAAPVEGGGFELRYAKFSAVMHKHRRLALFTAANVDWRSERRLIDGRKPTRHELTEIPKGHAERWVEDPRIAAEHQLPDVFYSDDRGSFDKGHLVRREDVCWGSSFAEIQKANGDTFHVTNCAPQTRGFNRASAGEDNWGDLEGLVRKGTRADRAVVLGGPVLAADDPWFDGRDEQGPTRVQIPQRFWKIIVVRDEDGRPAVHGFVLEQDLSEASFDFTVPPEWKAFTRPIEEIEALLGGWVELGYLVEHDRFEEE